MTKTVYVNGSPANSTAGNRWEQAADAIIARAQHAPGFNVFFPEAESGSIAAAAAAAGPTHGLVSLAAGVTYTVSGQIPTSGADIIGWNSTIKVADGTDAGTFSAILNPTRGRFEGFTLDMNKANTTAPSGNTLGNGIYVATASWTDPIVLRGVHVINCHEAGIRLITTGSVTDPAILPSSPVIVDHCYATGCDYGLRLANLANPEVIGGDYSGNVTSGVHVQLCKDPAIIGVTANSNTSGHGITAVYNLRARIEGCSANLNAGGGIVVGGGSTTLNPFIGNVITGNTCDGNALNGITLDPTISGADGVPVTVDSTVTDNTCRGNTLNGINLTCAQDVTVTGNISKNNGAAGIGVSTARAEMSGNLCRGNATYGIALNTGANYGDHTIGVNKLAGNTIGRLLNAATIPSQFAEVPLRVVQAADQPVNNSATLIDVTGFTVPLEANAVYEGIAQIGYNATTTADMKVKWSLPAGATAVWGMSALVSTATASNSQIPRSRYNQASTATAGGSGADAAGDVLITITTGATAGSAGIQFAQNTAEVSDTKFLAGSWLKLNRVA